MRCVPVPLVFGVLVAFFSGAGPAQAQCDEPVFGPRAGQVEGRKPTVPLGFASEDWRWSYATGRSVLVSVVPTTAAGVALRLGAGESRDGQIVAGSVMAAAVAVGPSLGQWSLGGRCLGRSVLPTALRLGGIGGVAWALQAGDGNDGLAGPLARTVLAIPGLVAVTVGILWALSGTPRIAVRPGDRERDGPAVDLQPLVQGPTGSGLQVRVQW